MNVHGKVEEEIMKQKEKKTKTAKNNLTVALKSTFRDKVVCCDCDMS